MSDNMTQWPSGIRDTTEFPTVKIDVDVHFREHLEAFSHMDGIGWNDYDSQGAMGNGQQPSDQRLRTYRKMYERLGLIYKQNNLIRVSRLGVSIRDLEANLNAEKDNLLNELRETAIDILARYQLRNPVDGPDLPISCDVHPYLCIWATMYELDNKINYEEMNRVILRILSMADLPAAIEKIRAAREKYGDYTALSDPEQLDTILGLCVHTDQPTARIAPWFSFAGWGGLIIEPQVDDSGYRHLVPAAVPFVRSILEKDPFFFTGTDKDEWLNYYIGSASVQEEVAQTDTTVSSVDEETRIPGGFNTLLYGVPGSGKSWTIEHEYCKPGTKTERLVFHPDYTHADFVGQILPVVDPVDKLVTYEFTPGPFTNILREAYLNPTQRYILIVEEINRGNAPAIFGDIFQLLDRTADTQIIDGITYPAGTSQYGITNAEIAKVVYGDSTSKIRIPSNLSILGTMNTSDQNVFTLDTAFQRRWYMRLIENNFEYVRSSLANASILDTHVTWRKFCETINSVIISSNAQMASTEDKRLGAYFVHEKDLHFDSAALPTAEYCTIEEEYNFLRRKDLDGELSNDLKVRLSEIQDALRHNRMFPEKVLKYLWDDAFKFNPEALFDTQTVGSLEDVIRVFVYNTEQDRFNIFKPSVQQALSPNL